MSLMTQRNFTRSAARSIKSARGYDYVASAGRWLRTAMAGSNLFIVLALCAVGLLVILNVMFRFPNFGMEMEQFNVWG
jgi:hypothetical protein